VSGDTEHARAGCAAADRKGVVKIKIFAVGGTIDKIYFDPLSQYQVGSPNAQEILDALPIAFEYEIESLLRKDSLDMNDADRQLVRDRVAADPFLKNPKR
jgi:L-asparaginase